VTDLSHRAAIADPSDELAAGLALAERARRGEMTPERLVAAARLGHRAARAYTGETVEVVNLDAGIALLGDRERRLFACDCAERVIPIWEVAYPDDPRPRAAIAVARRYANGQATDDELADAASAAWAAAGDAWAAWAAEPAAAPAAEAAAWAAVDAAWDAAVDAAWDAAWAADVAAEAAARASERAWQRARLAAYLLGEV